VGGGPPTLAACLDGAFVVALPFADPLQGSPGETLLFSGLEHRICALFAENMHLAEADRRERRNLREVEQSDGVVPSFLAFRPRYCRAALETAQLWRREREAPSGFEPLYEALQASA
jgi:hypothetical protein